MKQNIISGLTHSVNKIVRYCQFSASRIKEKAFGLKSRLLLVFSLSIVSLIFISCKPSCYLVSDHGTVLSVKMPVASAVCDTAILKSSFSNEFEGTNGDLQFKNNYTLRDSTIVGFNIFEIKEEEYKNEEQLKIRKGEVIGVTKWVSNNVTHTECEINGYKFLLIFYQLSKSKSDYFVFFESEKTRKLQFRGRIRFPSDYSLNKIKRKSVDIISDISKAK